MIATTHSTPSPLPVLLTRRHLTTHRRLWKRSRINYDISLPPCHRQGKEGEEKDGSILVVLLHLSNETTSLERIPFDRSWAKCKTGADKQQMAVTSCWGEDRCAARSDLSLTYRGLQVTACTTTDKDRRHLSRRPARKFLTTPPFLRLFRSFHHRPLLEEFTRKGEESFVLNDLIIFHESFFGYSSFSPPRRYFTRFSSTIFRVYIHDTLLLTGEYFSSRPS